MPLSIAIDGPAGAGKSTIASALAGKLGIRCLDTGAMYRAVALYMIRMGIDPGNRESVMSEMPNVTITVRFIDDIQHTFLNGEDVTGQIRTPDVSQGASCVSSIPGVRRALVPMQRTIADDISIVMDGRDIGTVVLPDASIKLYVTADAEERARRRQKETFEKTGEEIPLEAVLADINERDLRDMTREDSPLKQAEDAVLVDTTRMTIEESVEYALLLVREAVK